MPSSPTGPAHLQLLLPLQGELLEGLDDQAGVGAVVDEDGRAAHPRLEVVDGQGDILSIVLEKKQCAREGPEGLRGVTDTLPTISPPPSHPRARAGRPVTFNPGPEAAGLPSPGNVCSPPPWGSPPHPATSHS